MTDLLVSPEEARVRAGWKQVGLRERVSGPTLRQRVIRRLLGKRARSADELRPLTTGSRMRPAALRIYQGPSNQVRFRRSLGYVHPDDRVFEIGLGRGYFAGLLLRDGDIQAHRGIDLLKRNVRATGELLELNGLAERSELTSGDLYDLTPEEVEKFGATLMVCCEVIEHVPDPEGALRTLAAALPDGAELLLSVPLLGRLERVWGHVSIFDQERIRNMVEDAGLVIHAAEVVYDTWVFVLASHDSNPSVRAARAASRNAEHIQPEPTQGRVARPTEAPTPRSVRKIDIAASSIRPSEGTRLSQCDVTINSDGDAACELKAESGGPARRSRGGLRLSVGARCGVRLELAPDDIADVRRLEVDGFSGGRRVIRWSASTRRLKSKKAITALLRPGVRDAHFKAVETDEFQSMDDIEISAVLRARGSAKFRVTRAAAYQ